MGKRVEPPAGESFAMHEWLEDSRAIARAKRLAIKKYVPLALLPHELRRLVDWGVVSYVEVRVLLDGLEADGLITTFESRYHL